VHPGEAAEVEVENVPAKNVQAEKVEAENGQEPDAPAAGEAGPAAVEETGIQAVAAPAMVHPGEDFDLYRPAPVGSDDVGSAEPAETEVRAQPETPADLPSETELPHLENLVEEPGSSELPPIEPEPTSEFVVSPEAPNQEPQPSDALPSVPEQPSFSHPPAATGEGDIDDDYDPDAETVMRVQPIDLSAEEEENDGR
jgi:hypothetical protein